MEYIKNLQVDYANDYLCSVCVHTKQPLFLDDATSQKLS